MTDDQDADLALAIALANRTHAEVAPGRWEREGLRSAQDVEALLSRHGIAPPRPVSAADLAAVREIRDHLQTIFGEARDHPDVAVRSLNALLEGVPLRAEVVVADSDVGLVIEPAADEGLVARLRATVALAVAHAAERSGLTRLRRCAYAPSSGEGCTRVFIDTSKNGLRRFCCPQCATRTHVGALRQRRRGEAMVGA